MFYAALLRPLLALVLPVATSFTAPPAAPTVLRAGTIVVLETASPISSADAQVGQNVGLHVKYNVIIKGRTVIKAGASGSALITDAQKRRGLGKEGSLSIKPSVVQAVDGQMVPLSSNGAGSAGKDTKGATIGLAVVVSPLFLLKKGKEATIPAGYELQATVANDTEIE